MTSTPADAPIDQSQEQIKRLNELIGSVVTAWSEIDAQWYLVFGAMMTGTTQAQIDAIFFQFDSGAAVRQLIASVADATYPPKPNGYPHKINKQIGQLLARTNDMVASRNSAAHAAINYVPAVGIKASRSKRKSLLAGLSFQDAEAQLIKANEDLFELGKSLDRLLRAISPDMDLPRALLAVLRKRGVRP